MSAATSRCDSGGMALAGGVAEITFRRRGAQTALARLFQQAPLRVLFPRSEQPDVPLAVLICTSGGLVGGDRLGVRIHLEPHASAVVMTQAAERIYRSTGENCQVHTIIEIQEGGHLDYLPHETIMFEGARLERTTTIALTARSRVLAGGMLVFGRTASGEVFRRGYIRDAWEVHRNGRLLWADALMMDGRREDEIKKLLAAPACFGGAVAVATAVFAGDDDKDDTTQQLALARMLLDAHTADENALRSGATVMAGLIVVRWIGTDAYRLRAAFSAFLAHFRHQAMGRTPSLPRPWSV